MSLQKREFYLKIALVATGLIFLFGLYPLINIWPVEGWRWTPHQREYEEMIMGVYATLGIFLLWAVRRPQEHRSLIWFTAWSSLVHGGIMLYQAIIEKSEMAHLWGDVPALLLVGGLLFWLMWGLPKQGTS